MTSPTVRLHGTDDGSPVVVLIPGVGGSSAHDFAFVLPMLARTHLVAVVDFPEDGATAQTSTADPRGTVRSLAERVVAALTAAVPGRAIHLIGNSVGAAVATRIAASCDRVLSLVLLNGVSTATTRQRGIAATWAAVERNAPAALADFATVVGLGAALDVPDVDGPRTPVPFPLTARAGIDVALLAGIDVTDVTDAITAPTLVVSGTGDVLAGVEQGKQLFSAILNSRFVEIPTGHALTIESPALVLAIVRDFLAAPERHPAGTLVEAAVV